MKAGCSAERRRLRRLVSDSLRPLSTLKRSSPVLSNEAEKDHLLVLTSVFRQVKHWTRHEVVKVEGKCSLLSGSQCDGVAGGGCDCLEDAVALLISILMADSLYVKHLAGKILVEIFKFLIMSEEKWKEFLLLLWINFEESFGSVAVMSKSNQSEPVSGPVKEDHSMATTLVKVLQDILKHVKMKHTDHLKSCMDLAITSLSDLPWDSLLGSHNYQTVGGWRCAKQVESSPTGQMRLQKSDSLLLGMLLRLLCSVVDLKSWEDSTVRDFGDYSRLMSLVQKMLSFCLEKSKEYKDISILHYLRHKALMLMTRLSFGVHWKYTFVMSWLELLRQHFEDLLYLPISQCHAKTGNSLHGSPFLVGYTNEEVDNQCRCHLQRQANYLFLKCCLASSHFNSESAAGCVNLIEYQDECSRELLMWLKKHVSADTLVEHNVCSASCNFSMSLLLLYLDEDDMLFELLLLLLDAAYFNFQENSDECSKLFIGMRSDIAPQLSSIFNPVHLFHLFLFLLHYDQTVLLDYLISKDTGIQCLRYLMRCLRWVCRSWSVFVKFSDCEFDNEQLDSQGRKDYTVTGESNKNHGDIGRKRRKMGPWTFENAKSCLLSLGRSIEDLHRKSLFPYNPNALLKSFSRFQELCQNEN